MKQHIIEKTVSHNSKKKTAAQIGKGQFWKRDQYDRVTFFTWKHSIILMALSIILMAERSRSRYGRYKYTAMIAKRKACLKTKKEGNLMTHYRVLLLWKKMKAFAKVHISTVELQ